MPGVPRHGGVEARPEFGFVEPQVGRGKFVLGRVAAIQAGFGHAGVVDNLIDSHGTNALAIEQLAGGFEDPFRGASFRRLLEPWLGRERV